jgi:hypothetical protein
MLRGRLENPNQMKHEECNGWMKRGERNAKGSIGNTIRHSEIKLSLKLLSKFKTFSISIYLCTVRISHKIIQLQQGPV